MSVSAALTQLLDDINADLHTYRRLAQMFDVQFAAALRLDADVLKRTAEQIEHEVGLLDARRRARSGAGQKPLSIAYQQTGRTPVTTAATAQRATLDVCREEWKAAVKHCKAQAVRNGNLLASQFEMMQRLLHGEKHTYVPG